MPVVGDGCETLWGDVLVVPTYIRLIWAPVPIIGWVCVMGMVASVARYICSMLPFCCLFL